MTTVRIPADVDREDRLLAGLTARQLAWLSGGGVLLLGLWSATRAVVPLPLLVVAGIPVAVAAVALALGHLDGLPADRFALAAVRHARSPHRLVPAPGGVPDLPSWAGRHDSPDPLPFPVAGTVEGGALDLGDEGLTLVCRASSLNFDLRSPDEQDALVGAFARWLNSLDGPVQIVVRAERVDVGAAVTALRAGAGSLPHPALAAAAHEHAAFVEELAGRRDILRRSVLIVFRQAAVPGADELLRRRAEEAGRALASAGVTVVPLSEQDAVAALANAVDPDAPMRPAGLALPDETIGGAP